MTRYRCTNDGKCVGYPNQGQQLPVSAIEVVFQFSTLAAANVLTYNDRIVLYIAQSVLHT